MLHSYISSKRTAHTHPIVEISERGIHMNDEMVIRKDELVRGHTPRWLQLRTGDERFP